MSRSLLRVAQAAQEKPRKKIEIGPATPAAIQAAAAAASADDPPLMKGLGTRSMKVTTSSRLAQQFFDQGYRLAWAFNHDEALRAFRKAQRLDPRCAMCFWGEAWALGPNINVPMEPKAIDAALAAIEKAQRLASPASKREQALIGALAARYSADTDADRAALDAAYAGAMRKVEDRFRSDVEVAVLYADALMNVAPWDYWEPGGKRLRAPVADLVHTLERVPKQDPEHAGAIHLYIHAVEASSNPKRAERYADRLAKLAPAAGHLVHMPSHIYFVLGRYKDSLAANVQAVKADEAYLAAHKPEGVYPLGYYTHNVHFVMVSAQMGGDGKTVLASADKLSGLIPAQAAREVLMLRPESCALLRSRAIRRALGGDGAGGSRRRASVHPDRMALRARDCACAHRQRESRRERARANRAHRGDDRLQAVRCVEDSSERGRTDRRARAAHVLRARIAQAGNDLDGAVREMQAAIRIQDTLPYMEPAYWYYPVRQSLGALLLQKGDTKGARDAFSESLARAPNNAWSLYGLSQAYAREGKAREAKAVEERFMRAWTGGTSKVDIAAL